LFIGKLGEKGFTQVDEKPVVEKPTETVVEKKDTVVFETVIPVDSSTIKKPEVEKPVVKKPEGKPFFFKFVNAATGNEVIGEVHIQESTKATQYQPFGK